MTQQLPEPIQFGKYALYERIGRGGMADVFKGRIKGPEGFERVFVVKRILPHLCDDPAFMKMFVEEAKMSARLNHPNIVQIFELGSVDGELFISMEHIPGHDLAETMRALWKASGPPRPDLVAYVGREMCRALAYAHESRDERGRLLGMIHRDVSPSNVMLSYEGAVKLLDFGIAKALSDAPDASKSGNGTLKGKYAYMAPEQTESDDVDHRIDIFAAGIVLHEVLTGRRLFKGQNDIQTIERVRRCEVLPPSQVNPACPPALDAVVLRALARKRDDRFQSGGEMADALDEIVYAAHFTPQHLATIMRDAFGVEGSTDRRFTSSTTNPAPSSSSIGRSRTVPPIAISGPRSAMGAAAAGAATGDAATLDGITARPLWKRAPFWMVAVLCAGGVGLAIARGVGGSGQRPLAAGALAAAAAPASRAGKRVKNTPVLIQSDPEGADIFVTGKFESVGRTPMWVTLQMDPNDPARVMIRKAGFQDKAIAVEMSRPPSVQLIPIDVPPTPKPVDPQAAVTASETGSPPAVPGPGAGSASTAKRADVKKIARRHAFVRRPR